ncbi:transposable element Tcb1 transposase [Trichonephila clavipes]|nr:transposable element Tcb1 transposase [Trichonephila clavipes]
MVIILRWLGGLEAAYPHCELKVGDLVPAGVEVDFPDAKIVGTIITRILKKNMQITGNHQMARKIRHNDESVREGYIRNDGKELKLFTGALKAFQCNNRIVMAQRKHLDDLLRRRIIGRLECGRTQLEVSEELGTPRVSSRGFRNDSKIMVM